MFSRWRTVAATTRRHGAEFSSWPPKLESATGRARKRRRKSASRAPEAANKEASISSPKGWRVLWPSVYDEPRSWMESIRSLPRGKDFQRAWAEYKLTWAHGLRGDAPVKGEETDDTLQESSIDADKIRQNLSQNITTARGEAQQLAEQLSTSTGIRNQQDLRKFATDMMKLATDSLREFMGGYREGRDQEVEKMLNEYFQEEEEKEASVQMESQRRRRRKPKWVNLRQ